MFTVAFIDASGRNELFDVTLYDREVMDETTGRNAEDQSLVDLRDLIGLANAALRAGLQPEPVADKAALGAD